MLNTAGVFAVEQAPGYRPMLARSLSADAQRVFLMSSSIL
jgi:hypothetical protein